MDKLEKGDWLLMEHGFYPKEFCVLDVTEDMLLLGRSGWLVQDAIWMSHTQLKSRFCGLLGKTKERWWWRIFFGMVFPYSRPRMNK
jgi:hypothetical protein